MRWSECNWVKGKSCILEAHTIFSLLPLQSSRHLNQVAFPTRASCLFKLRLIPRPHESGFVRKGLPSGSYWGFFAVCLDTRKN